VQTRRLELRELHDGDAAFVVELLNEPAFLEFIGDRGVRTEADARGYVARLRATHEQHGFGMYVAVSRERGEPLGLCGLVVRDTLPRADLGFAFLARHRGQGFAREAAAAVLAFADARGLGELLAICSQHNLASQRVLEAVGFHFSRLMPHGGEALCLYVRPGGASSTSTLE
jgi:RimJ/RimL family protein N-acetyltransferase